MKYLSLLLVLVAMYWTWGLSQSHPPVTEVIHIGIQNDLKQVITKYIQEHLPSATDIRFNKFWSETLKKDQIKAMFMYSFAETNQINQVARISIEGYAILNREKSTEVGYDIWSFDELFILNNKVAFEEGLTIKAATENE